MYKIKRLLYIHMILIYFTFIYSQGYLSSHKQAYASEGPPPPPLSSSSTTTTDSSDDMTEDKIKSIKEQFKELAKERLFDLKGKPSTETINPNTKLYVPSAMLKEYIGFRDLVREVVPNDRDFYGKINIDKLDSSSHGDVWSAVSNKYGSYDIEVDMGPPDEGPDSSKFHRTGEASHIALITPERDPEDVPANTEPLLPPHSRSVQNQRKFASVHLHYNLSQEVYSSPTASEDLKGAELQLTRERIYDCELNDCPRKPIPFFNKLNRTISRHGENAGSSGQTNRLNNVPRYQRIFILQVNGYDQSNEPMTSIFTTRRIDTRQTTPLTFNIYPIVKTWLLNPKSNHGIIVRVTNDDKPFDTLLTMKKKVDGTRSSPTNKREINSTSTNASDGLESSKQLLFQSSVLEHVRLKRAFRFASDSQEVWRDKQPSIMIWSKPSQSERRHVKRHQDEEAMQADDPNTTTQDSQQASTTTSTNEESPPHASSTQATMNHNDKSSSTSTYGPLSKRDHVPTPTSAGGRRASQPGRASSSGRASSQQQGGGSRSKGKGRPSVKQTDKCSKRSLNINFDEVGWSSWIIAPHSYYANYCAGDCNWPLSDTQNSTNHAIIQAIYRSVGRLVPKSCCAPVKLGRMAILYQLDGIVQMRQYDDMIVEACGCL